VSKETKSNARTLAEVTEDAEASEIAHMMVCKASGCTRCNDETPPAVKARRYFA
jgi:ferredoxin